MTETEKIEKFQTANAISISISHLLHDIYSSFLAPLLPLLIEKLNISYSLASFLWVAQRIPTLMNPFIGLVADKISLRYFIIISPSLTAISMSLLGVAPYYFVLVILLLIMGISATLFHVPAPVMMRQVAGNRVGLGMGLFMLGGELARTIGPLAILGAVSLWGMEGTYKLIPIGLGCSFILFFRVRKIKIPDHFRKNKADADLKLTIRKALPTLKMMAGIVFFRSAMRGALTMFLPVYISSQGESIWMAGTALAVVQFAGAGGTIFAGTISDKIGRRAVLLVTAIVSPILMGLFLIANNTFLFPVLLLTGVFLFAPRPVMLATVNELETEHPSFVNGVYMMMNFLLNAAAMILIGVLGDHMDLTLAYKLAAVMALGSIPFAWKIKN